MLDNGYSYLMNLLISVDQLLNSILGGSCDETLSSRAYRQSLTNSNWMKFRKVVDRLFWFDVDSSGRKHCELSYIVEMERGHLPKSVSRSILLGE